LSRALVKVDTNLWQQELDLHKELFESLKDRVPEAFFAQKKTLRDLIK
jgi:GTP-dependent phosphoenolpyruvate carboxykinase